MRALLPNGALLRPQQARALPEMRPPRRRGGAYSGRQAGVRPLLPAQAQSRHVHVRDLLALPESGAGGRANHCQEGDLRDMLLAPAHTMLDLRAQASSRAAIRSRKGDLRIVRAGATADPGRRARALTPQFQRRQPAPSRPLNRRREEPALEVRPARSTSTATRSLRVPRRTAQGAATASRRCADGAHHAAMRSAAMATTSQKLTAISTGPAPAFGDLPSSRGR